MELAKRVSLRIARIAFVRQALNEQVDFRDLKRKPSPKLWLAIGIILLSHLTCWPIITILAVTAVKFNDQSIFSVGSPCAYAFSHLLFFAGMFIAGAEGLDYFKAFLRWSVGLLLRGSLIRSLIPSDTNLKLISLRSVDASVATESNPIFGDSYIGKSSAAKSGQKKRN